MRRAILTLIGVAAFVGVLIVLLPKRPKPSVTPPVPRLAWVFEAPRPGTVIATPCVTPESVYLSAAHSRGFHRQGAVYAIDPASGNQKWMFDRDGQMLPVASSPLASGAHLVVGEGMHGNFACRLQCLDRFTGRLRWEFETGDHIEGAPAANEGLVLFPAGNDGLYAVDAENGAYKWSFRADLHIDSTPDIAGGRVYVGSGKSRRFSTYQVLCLEARSGKPVWRMPVNLPAWGNPAVVRDHVLIGLGNGRLNESAAPPETPAGALACFDADTGKQLWNFPTGDAVFGRAVATDTRVLVGSRDGNLYGVTWDGREAFRVAMGGPVVAGVALSDGRAYAVSVAGRIVCIDPSDGHEIWHHELGRSGAVPRVFATPVIDGGRMYIAAEMTTGETGIVSLFCFDLPRGDNS